MAFRKDLNDVRELSDSQTSKINAAGLINSTLENLWSACYHAMASGNYTLWNIKLDSIWAILGGDEPLNGEAEKAINEIDLRIYQTGILNSRVNNGFDKKKNPMSALQYQLLKRKSLMLRRLQNKQGKGTAYKSEDEDDIS